VIGGTKVKEVRILKEEKEFNPKRVYKNKEITIEKLTENQSSKRVII